ncbi:MAG: hypothetical protein BSOLF_0956 [Candidatus Carbobacillus altaicus]|uniref:Uncharacterized protein n=1 Tax=Candidatus Carbonibacillus altaicus TaxID=2163959 RepID=A0A2R6XX83_9BACL|nr:MAG: hypothetical protein BSOLF_0956 [Candidatus Carbobacillus altaicus]
MFNQYREASYFWDIVGPVSLLFFAIFLILSVHAVKKKSILLLLISVIVTGIVSYITLWSIGRYLFVIMILQFIALGYITYKKFIN